MGGARKSRPANRSGRRAQKQVASREPAIDEYLASVSPGNRPLLEALRETIHALVPEVEECISYRLPAFRYEGRVAEVLEAIAVGG
jgi:uncharacterized protein YdhG (YjbR/CyaY superfamily)